MSVVARTQMRNQRAERFIIKSGPLYQRFVIKVTCLITLKDILGHLSVNRNCISYNALRLPRKLTAKFCVVYRIYSQSTFDVNLWRLWSLYGVLMGFEMVMAVVMSLTAWRVQSWTQGFFDPHKKKLLICIKIFTLLLQTK